MSQFAELVRGRTVAVVGRAPMLKGDAKRIDAHDLVYRVSQTPVGGKWGERTDIVFLNWQQTRDIHLRRLQSLRERLVTVPWWVHKAAPDRPVDGISWRVARWPNIKNPTAVTLMLWDLIRHHEPASVTVFGADLYAAGPEGSYDPTLPEFRDEQGAAKGVIVHRPWEQRKVHRALVSTGRIVGDRRYLDAVAMSDADYQAVLDRWDAVYRSTPAPV